MQPYSDIIEFPNFENGILKIQSGKEHELNLDEKAAVKTFLKSGVTDDDEEEEEEEEEDLGYAGSILRIEQVSKRQRLLLSIDVLSMYFPSQIFVNDCSVVPKSFCRPVERA